MWSPNPGNNYPFGTPLPQAEISALDTNGNGQLDIGDDPYTAYWPGTEYVDWIGTSAYWKGYLADGFPQTLNKVAPTDFFTQLIMGGSEGVNTAYPFYNNFCVKYNKPLIVSYQMLFLVFLSIISLIFVDVRRWWSIPCRIQ